jgi:hypothetical protein
MLKYVSDGFIFDIDGHFLSLVVPIEDLDGAM